MRRCLAVFFLMAVATRLLMSGSGAGAFAPPGTIPPFDASWTRSPDNPILVPSLAWEQTSVVEPCVRIEGNAYRMWYTGGWANPGIGHATNAGDPTDPADWVKAAAPVYGQGGSSWAGNAGQPEVFVDGSTYYLYVSNNAAPAVRIATSSDGLAWTTQSSSVTLPSGKTLWGNRAVWKESGTWYMLQEAGPTAWETYLYTSSDGLTWTIGNSGNALTTLRKHASGMYGGPNFASHGSVPAPTFSGTYRLWYHASAVSGNTPTDIYAASSADKITWTPGASPVLTHLGSGFEVDQVADPQVVVWMGTAYLFYDGVNNPASQGRIGVATAPATY